MEAKATLRYAKMGVQKSRPVANMIRGKNVNDALKALSFVNKKSATIIKGVLESAIANAEFTKKMDVDRLFVKTITVDQGPYLKRFRPRAQGRATGVKKKMSHVNIVLSER